MIPARFNELMFHLKVPKQYIPSASAEQSDRAIALLKWAKGYGGCGLEKIEQALSNKENADTKYSKVKEAADWKALHETFQALNTKLIIIQGLIKDNDYNRLIGSLETHWSMECQPQLLRSINLNRIVGAGKVKDEFEEEDQNGEKWRNKLKEYAESIDTIVASMGGAGNIPQQIQLLGEKLSSLLNLNIYILSYLDDKLRVKILEII
jgi:hypothetical protein